MCVRNTLLLFVSSLICLYLQVNSSPNRRTQISHLSSKKVTELFFLTTAASLSCPFYLKCLKSVLLGDLLNLSVTACLLSSTVSGTVYPVLPNYSVSYTILAKLSIVVMKLTYFILTLHVPLIPSVIVVCFVNFIH